MKTYCYSPMRVDNLKKPKGFPKVKSFLIALDWLELIPSYRRVTVFSTYEYPCTLHFRWLIFKVTITLLDPDILYKKQ